MREAIEFGGADFVKTLPIVQVFWSLGKVILRGGVFGDTREDLFSDFGNHCRKMIVWHDNARFVMNVETKIHIWKPCNKIFHHAGRRLLLPFVAIADGDYFAVSDSHSNQSTVVMTDSILNAQANRLWLQRPKRQQHLVDHVKLVDHDNVTTLSKLKPLIEMRRGRNAISAPVFMNSLIQ